MVAFFSLVSGITPAGFSARVRAMASMTLKQGVQNRARSGTGLVSLVPGVQVVKACVSVFVRARALSGLVVAVVLDALSNGTAASHGRWRREEGRKHRYSKSGRNFFSNLRVEVSRDHRSSGPSRDHRVIQPVERRRIFSE